MHATPPKNDTGNSHEAKDLDHANLFTNGLVKLMGDHQKPDGYRDSAESGHE